MEIRIDSLNNLPEAATIFLNELAGNRKFAFYGEMGAGKTTFIRALLEVMKVDDHVSSPTFSIINEYFSVPFGTIYHFDFYRIELETEALDIGVEELFESNAYCFVEWPEKIHNLLHESFVKVKVTDCIDYRLIEVER